jgi:ABC-type glycerol-3-phosphate transport system permease component
MNAKSRTLKDFPIHLVVGGIAVLTLYPFIFMLITSLKSNEQFYQQFWGIAKPLQWANYVQAWEGIRGYVLNSFIVSVTSVVGVLAVASLSAYAFARYRFPGSTVLFYMVIALMMIPGVLTLISSFMWMKQFPFAGGNNWLGNGGTGLLNSHLALILPYISGGQVFTIFVLRSFISGIPEDLFEAARIDGATDWQTFRKLVLPLSMPILGTMAIMNLLSVWNDYVWPLIVLSDDAKRTLTIGLAFFQGMHSTTYGPLMAGYALACLPLLLLFLFTMRYFVEGLTSGALKA